MWQHGAAHLGKVLTARECIALRKLYDDESNFRTRIDMARYRFGSGEYQYFRYPLPDIVQRLRETLYAQFAPLANEWMEALGLDSRYPAEHAAFVKQCHQSGQKRPTPLMLRYREGDYNCLHQDLYGPVVFPFQAVVALSKRGDEYTGGELMLVEQRPRAQSAGEVIALDQGEAVLITTRYRPQRGARGWYRTNVKHGVSRVRGGERYTLGIIFHDAE